ncbi:FAD-binding oxidoreductase [Paucibacter soli]|uniref:FAD-binding oxidoreductase n=1 Tax=Paucibacter soli TaxID=3133433 RepID=UPI0030B00D1D
MTLIDELRALLGEAGVLDAEALATRTAGAFRRDNLQALALARPASTEEVSKLLRFCSARQIRVVPQGGLTGLVHGADAAPQELILSLERMRRIERIDVLQRVAVAEAGVTLQALQEAVEAQGLAFALDLGARGTATLGGNAATNAGGNRVLRYGMMRDMVLGLEVVLADGTVLSSMNELIKNNSGYDLKQLFIGSEGTLGVITRLVLRLREQPGSSQLALAGLARFGDLPLLLKHLERELGGELTAFEVMWQDYYRLVSTAPARGQPPISQQYPFYALVEARGVAPERFQAVLALAMEAGLVADAALAQSEADALAFWALREDVEQVARDGMPLVYDISLPIGAMEAYTRELAAALSRLLGDAHRLWIFGHLGDGNLHLVVQLQPQAYTAARPQVDALVYAPLAALRGSVSAEHGIGLEKKPWLAHCRNDAELRLMRTLKTALDPQGLLNPGKIL